MTTNWKTTSAKRWVFNFYFYYKNESRERAAVRRHRTVMCLRGLLEGKSNFAVIARDENREQSCLLLQGYMRLKSPCNKPHAKSMLGKYSNARPTTFGDVFHLMRYFHVDRKCNVIGRLPGVKGIGKGDNSTEWVLKTLAEQIDDKQDFYAPRMHT